MFLSEKKFENLENNIREKNRFYVWSLSEN